VKQTERWKQWSLTFAAKLGGRLPRIVAYGLARLAGDLAYYLRTPTRLDVEDNMRHVMGPRASQAAVRGAAKEAFRNVARYYVDLVRLPQTSPEQLLNETVRLHGFERLAEPLQAGQGVIVATAHFGNPEMAVQVGAILGLDVLVLAEPLQPPAFARLMEKIRSAYGPRYEDVGFSTIAHAIRHLRAGGCLAITCDRDIQGKGVPLPFFGQEARLPLGAVDLAARTGALLMPGYCRRIGPHFDVYFEEPVSLISTGRPKEDALENAKALLARVEPWIRSDPGQWMPLERIWKPVGASSEARDVAGNSAPEPAAASGEGRGLQ
jgi:KDO2-lipid IV(A) lauroyltransferase